MKLLLKRRIEIMIGPKFVKQFQNSVLSCILLGDCLIFPLSNASLCPYTNPYPNAVGYF